MAAFDLTPHRAPGTKTNIYIGELSTQQQLPIWSEPGTLIKVGRGHGTLIGGGDCRDVMIDVVGVTLP